MLDEIHAAPDDDAPRLAWANAIEATDAARADLVRTQCSLARTPDDGDLIRRERALLEKNAARWEKELRPAVAGASFVRGFPQSVFAKMKPLLEAPDALLAKTPLVHLGTRSLARKQVDAIGEMPLFRNVRSITAAECALDARSVAGLLRAPAVRALSLPYDKLGPDAVRALVDDPAFGRLEWLDLGANKFFDEDLAPLLGASSPSLHHLGLWGGVLAALDGMVVLANRLALPSLFSLAIGSNRILGEDLRPLEGVAALAQLRRLDVGQNEIGSTGARVLGRGPWRGLVELLVSSDLAAKPGLGDLATGAWPALERLTYQHAELGPSDVAAFAEHDWPSLGELAIGSLDAKSVSSIAAANFRERLRVLSVRYCTLGDGGVATLLAKPWPELRELHLPTSDLGDATAKLLVETDALPRVHTLTMPVSALSAPMKRALRSRFGTILDEVDRGRRMSDDPSDALRRVLSTNR